MTGQDSSDRYLTPEEAMRFYDSFGSRQDWQRFYEDPAIVELMSHASFEAANSVFEFGFGTGRLAARLLQRHLPRNATYVGADVSNTMLSLARDRLAPWSGRVRIYQSDGSSRILEQNDSFDRFVSTYVLDLLTPTFIASVILHSLARSPGVGDGCGNSDQASSGDVIQSSSGTICHRKAGASITTPK